MDEDISGVLGSYDRTIGRRGFVERFYEIFLASRPEIAALFTEADFNKQRRLLKKGLRVVVMFETGDAEARKRMIRIRETHSRANLQIRPEYYIHWLNSLLATVAEFDPHFDDELEGCWRRTIQRSINFIKAGY